MSAFILLTGAIDGRKYFINSDLVSSITDTPESEGGKGSFLRMHQDGGAGYFHLAETPIDIMQKINKTPSGDAHKNGAPESLVSGHLPRDSG